MKKILSETQEDAVIDLSLVDTNHAESRDICVNQTPLRSSLTSNSRIDHNGDVLMIETDQLTNEPLVRSPCGDSYCSLVVGCGKRILIN